MDISIGNSKIVYNKIQLTAAMSSMDFQFSLAHAMIETFSNRKRAIPTSRPSNFSRGWSFISICCNSRDVHIVLSLNLRTASSFNVWNVTSHSASRKKEIAFMNTISNSNAPQILRSFWRDFLFHYNFIATSLIFRVLWSRKILFLILYIPI